jgi:heme-degrading monooxygenase HmoA
MARRLRKHEFRIVRAIRIGGNKLVSDKEIQTIWEYEVRSDFIAQFITAYGPNGDWVKLFLKCPGFIKTELKRDLDNPNRFVTIDYWQSYSAFSSMKQLIATEYKDLDNQCEAYTLSENHIGIFEMVDNVEIGT